MRNGKKAPLGLSLGKFLCLSICGISFGVPPERLPDVPLCWFKYLTHLPCPACGLTHSFLCIGHGRWEDAWNWNPLGFLGFAVVLVWGGYSFFRGRNDF